MKSERFSGFGTLTASDSLRQKILWQAQAEAAAAPKRKKRTRRLVTAAACLAVVVIAGALVASRIFGGVVYSSDTLQILSHPPIVNPFGSGQADYSLAVAPTEKALYAYANAILYGKVEGFKWVVLEKEKDPHFRYRTIVSVKILSAYKGDIAQDKTIDILLPVSISGNGGGTMVEDNENACRLKKGSEAFFFAKQYTDSDLIGDSSWNLHAKDICSYGTDYGDQYILPNKDDQFNYIFTASQELSLSQELSFQDTESIIKSKVK
jgi:hypothetical protein